MARDPTGSIVRNLFLLRQLENGLAREADRLLVALFDDIAAILARLDPTGITIGSLRRAGIERLVAEIERLTGQTFVRVLEQVRAGAAGIGSQQGAWAASTLERAVGSAAIVTQSGRVGLDQMTAILDTDPVHGHLLRDWFRGQSRATVFRIQQQVQLGMVQSETLGDIVRRVRGRSDGRGGFTGGVMETTTREATSIVRTAVNHVSNEAHIRTYRANADVVAELEFVAVLDRRTSEVCMGLDGRRWALGDEDIRQPPLHPQCRSALIPVIGWAGLGIAPPAEGTRASEGGQVNASTTYSDWLRDQPNGVQDEILGVGRAKLFRSGKITLAQLVTRDNRVRRLDELRDLAA